MKMFYFLFFICCILFYSSILWGNDNLEKGIKQNSYNLEASVLSAGGVEEAFASGSNYMLSATSGQTAIDVLKDDAGHTIYSGFWNPPVVVIVGIIEDITENILPKVYDLKQNYPNPFNPSTTIEYALPKISSVNIDVYDIMGQHILNLVSTNQTPGFYRVNWNAANKAGNRVSSGIYFYLIRAKSIDGEQFTYSKKMIITK